MATEPALRLDWLHEAYVRTQPAAVALGARPGRGGSRDVADEACAEAFAQAARRGYGGCATSMRGCGERPSASPPAS